MPSGPWKPPSKCSTSTDPAGTRTAKRPNQARAAARRPALGRGLPATARQRAAAISPFNDRSSFGRQKLHPMTRRLYLVRHAEPVPRRAADQDFARPLSELGQEQASQLGNSLQSQARLPEKLISSPAARARATAELLAQAFGLPLEQIESETELYQATARNLLDVINRQPDEQTALMLVGHNPAISRIVAYLTQHSLENMPPAGVASLSFELESWAYVSMATGHFEWFETPPVV